MSTEDVLKWLNQPEMQAVVMSPEMVGKWCEEISRRYSEEWRHYHTLHHLADMMKHLQTWRDSITDHAAVLLAILFHDIVYDPKSSTNEDDSVTMFRTFGEEVNMSTRLCEKVIRLITATIQHLPDDMATVDSDLIFFLDFDMAILGQPQQDYDLYAGNIQKEYCHMSAEAFCKGRSKVLQTFLERPRIYATEKLRNCFEAQARQNMQREIKSLQKQLLDAA